MSHNLERAFGYSGDVCNKADKIITKDHQEKIKFCPLCSRTAVATCDGCGVQFCGLHLDSHECAGSKECPNCGTKNPKRQFFCVECGTRFVDTYG